MKFLTFSCAVFVFLSVSYAQHFEDFEGFDTSSFDAAQFGGQDLSGFESGGYDGFSDASSDFNFGHFGGADVEHQFAPFHKK